MFLRKPFLHTKRIPSTIGRARSMGKKTRYRASEIYDDSDEYIFSSSFPYDESVSGMSPPISRTSFTPVNSYVKEWKAAPVMKARNPVQEKYIKLLDTANPSIVIAYGSAGTGKTLIPNSIGIQKLMEGKVNKLIITRPVVTEGPDQIGYLPGTLEQKMDPWMRPIYDVFYKAMSPQQVQNCIAKQQIEICPLAFMRGRTFENTWICADEMQNSTPNQMLMLLTRLGNNSKLIINGDPAQHDRGYDQNGLVDLLKRVQGKELDDIKVVQFTDEHIERHPTIKTILKLYKDN